MGYHVPNLSRLRFFVNFSRFYRFESACRLQSFKFRIWPDKGLFRARPEIKRRNHFGNANLST